MIERPCQHFELRRLTTPFGGRVIQRIVQIEPVIADIMQPIDGLNRQLEQVKPPATLPKNS